MFSYLPLEIEIASVNKEHEISVLHRLKEIIWSRIDYRFILYQHIDTPVVYDQTPPAVPLGDQQ